MIRISSMSLLAKTLVSTSVAITLVFLATGWFVQRHTLQTTTAMLNDEVRASFQAYESLWRSRAANLGSVSRVMASMSDVRAAFGTGDQATIRDTARDLWDRISDADAFFLVTDGRGSVIASLGGHLRQRPAGYLPFVESARAKFPDQASGFVFRDGWLYQVTVTPVYVQAAQGKALLNTLVAGYPVDSQLAQELKRATGGSEFLFVSGDRILASTLPAESGTDVVRRTRAGETLRDYSPLETALLDLTGKPIAKLLILRSFEGARQRMMALGRDVFLVYVIALLASVTVTYFLANRIVQPIEALDRAAAEVARQNYDYRVAVNREDELGRLASTFNTMAASVKSAREELIRHERIATISQLATSIVHDLRNPLAAIYGGAEMLVDSDLPPSQMKRLAANIYRASRHIQDMLQELTDISRGKVDRTEMCKLRDVITAAFEPLRPAAEAQAVAVRIEVPDTIEVPLARARMERVFANLMANALEAMRGGGEIAVLARRDDNTVLVDVKDTGPGIPAAVRGRMFQPFVSEGKKSGLGLGLALSRQTVLNHGGDLWVVEDGASGAHFRIRLVA